MANISKEADRKDFDERMKNNGNRPHVSTDRRPTPQEQLEQNEAELKHLRFLRAIAGLRKQSTY